MEEGATLLQSAAAEVLAALYATAAVFAAAALDAAEADNAATLTRGFETFGWETGELVFADAELAEDVEFLLEVAVAITAELANEE